MDCSTICSSDSEATSFQHPTTIEIITEDMNEEKETNNDSVNVYSRQCCDSETNASESQQCLEDMSAKQVSEVAKKRTIQTPNSLSVGYPSFKLLGHLTHCNEAMELLQPLSSSLSNLAAMSGEEVLNYFHKHILPVGHIGEELHHLLWTSVVPYVEPDREINTCVLLSNSAIYFLSDESPQLYKHRRPSWKTHSRNRSIHDTPRISPCLGTKQDSYHPRSGVLVCATEPASSGHVRPYATLLLSDLCFVHIGFFDQMFRVSGAEESGVFSCLTRDATLTEHFIKKLMNVLLMVSREPTPSPVNELEIDIFKTFSRQNGRWRPEGLEFKHPSQVKFIYPNEDAIRDLTFLMFQSVSNKSENSDNASIRSFDSNKTEALETVKILQYLLVLQINDDASNIQPTTAQHWVDVVSTANPSNEMHSMLGQAKSLIITTTHLCLASEDHVSYPLPEFARGLPEKPRFRIDDVHTVRSVQRIVCSDFMSHDVTIVFGDDEIIVDPQRKHYSEAKTPDGQMKSIVDKEDQVEKCWSLVIQSPEDKKRLLKLIERQIDVLEPGRNLSVQVSA